MKVALVTDHLISLGGGEIVLKTISDIFPDAPIYTLVYDKNNTYTFFNDKRIKTTFIQKIPFSVSRYQWTLPLRPYAVEKIDLSEYDLVISCSSSIAKGVIIRQDAVHINYCHTPTRFLWIDDRERMDFLEKIWPFSFFSDLYKKRLKVWDLKASERVDYFVSNSINVYNRIKKIYKRESEIIYPPVDISSFFISKDTGGYFLAGGRIVAYKKFDIIVRAFNKLKIPLKIFGTGPMYRSLRRIAGDNIEFLGNISEREKINLYSKAKAYISPQEEDFGISMVEAIASGCPVIAYRKGGALEIIQENVNGVFFDYQDWESLAEAVIMFDRGVFDAGKIRQTSEKFNIDLFIDKFRNFLNSLNIK